MAPKAYPTKKDEPIIAIVSKDKSKNKDTQCKTNKPPEKVIKLSITQIICCLCCCLCTLFFVLSIVYISLYYTTKDCLSPPSSPPFLPPFSPLSLPPSSPPSSPPPLSPPSSPPPSSPPPSSPPVHTPCIIKYGNPGGSEWDIPLLQHDQRYLFNISNITACLEQCKLVYNRTSFEYYYNHLSCICVSNHAPWPPSKVLFGGSNAGFGTACTPEPACKKRCMDPAYNYSTNVTLTSLNFTSYNASSFADNPSSLGCEGIIYGDSEEGEGLCNVN